MQGRLRPGRQVRASSRLRPRLQLPNADGHRALVCDWGCRSNAQRAADLLLENMERPDGWWADRQPAAAARPAEDPFARARAPLQTAPAPEADAAARRFDAWRDLYAWQLECDGASSHRGGRRRDCHFTDTPFLSPLKHLLEVEGGASE